MSSQRRFARNEKIPIVFSSEYNVSFCALQSEYPFETEKGSNVIAFLKAAGIITDENITLAMEIPDDELKKVHTNRYLDSLKLSDTVSQIAEIPLLHFVPNLFIQNSYLKPMKFQVGGTIKAGKLALRYGWAINMGGGFSHCSSDHGGSFSPYADVTLLVKTMFETESSVKNIMIIDCAARQGNGYARDLMDKKNVYIMDIYNKTIYPKDEVAKMAIRRNIPLPTKCEDEAYLRKLRINLAKSFNEFKPDLVIYIAGADVIEGDSMGELNITPEGIQHRDELVFTKTRAANVPIVMLLGTGFLKNTAEIMANSIINLKDKGFLPSKMWS